MKYVLSILCMFVCFSCYGFANNEHLPLKQLIYDVVAQNPNLAAANERIQAATFVIDRVQIPNDPQLSIGTNNNQFGPPADDFFPEIYYELSQTISFPGKLHLKGQIAKQQLAFTRYEKITTLKELILQTKKLYLQLSFNYLAQNINKKNSEIISSIIKAAIALYKTGKGRQEEIFKAQIEYTMLENELLILQSEAVSIKSMLNAFMNRPQTESIGRPEIFFHPKLNLSYDELEIIAIRERSELHGMKSMVDEQRTMSKLAKLNLFPDFTVSGMIHDMKRSHRHGWGINVSFDVPIFYNRKQRMEAQENDAKAVAYQNNLDGMRAMIRGQIKALLAKIQSAEKRIIFYKKTLLPKTLQTLSASEAKYRVGDGEFLFLLDTRRQLQNFQLSYKQTFIEREILFAELERAVGVPLEEVQHLLRNDDA